MQLDSIVPKPSSEPVAEQTLDPPLKTSWKSANVFFSILAGSWGALCFAAVALAYATKWKIISANGVLFLVLLISGCQAITIVCGAALAFKLRPHGYKLIIFGVIGFLVFMHGNFTSIDYIADIFLIGASLVLKKKLFPELPLMKTRSV